MGKFIVTGGNSLQGTIYPSGNKNEALPVLVASIMADSPITLHRLPKIQDILNLKKIIEKLGVTITCQKEGVYEINSSKMTEKKPDKELSKTIRGSFLLAAPLLYRFGHVDLPIPGGDAIGKRRLDTHLIALKALGAKVVQKEDIYSITCTKFIGADLFLDEASVMATENAIMAACIAQGKSTIYNAACEPHVQGLCHLLNKMGAKISGIGSNLLTIQGVSSLQGGEYTVQLDHTEIGSFIGLAAVTNSELTIHEAANTNMGLILHFFQKLGVSVEIRGNDLFISKHQKLNIKNDIDDSIPKIDDAPWPGFPADLTSIMTIVASQCHGTVLIFEKLFESRLFWVDKLISMGAKIILCDPHRAVVSGPSKLKGGILTSPDIRAGMALLIAALCAEGKSEIYNVQQIDRGYENIDIRLNALGAKIERYED